ncbi:MAG: hypothetical protein WCJ58_03820 [bacterium]
MTLFEFQTIEGQVFFTNYSPKEVAKFNCFDSYDDSGESVVIKTAKTDIKSFYPIN